MWPGAVYRAAGVWRLAQRWSGAASPASQAVLRLARGTGRVPARLDWRLPSAVCAAVACRGTMGSRRLCQRHRFVLACVRGAPAYAGVLCRRCPAPETARIVQNARLAKPATSSKTRATRPGLAPIAALL